MLEDLTVTQRVKGSSPLWKSNVLKMQVTKEHKMHIDFGRNISSSRKLITDVGIACKVMHTSKM